MHVLFCSRQWLTPLHCNGCVAAQWHNLKELCTFAAPPERWWIRRASDNTSSQKVEQDKACIINVSFKCVFMCFIFIYLKFFHHSEINKVCKCENTHKRTHTDSNVGGRALTLMWDLVMLLVFCFPVSIWLFCPLQLTLCKFFLKWHKWECGPPFDKRFPIWYEFCF